MTRLLPALVLVGACARSNERVLERLEDLTRRSPDAAADALLAERPRAVPPKQRDHGVTLPLTERGLPTVRGSINGVALWIILDSGASVVSLNGDAAGRVGLYLPPGDPVRAISPGFDARYRVGAFRALSLGGLEFGRGIATVPLTESRTRNPGHGLGPYAIVGCSVLSHYRVTFDFKRSEVHLVPHGGEGYVGTLFTPVTIGERRYWMLVDSGASRVFVEPWAARELGLISEGEAALHADKASTFGGGRFTAVKLPEMVVAGRRFEDVRAGVVNTFGGREVPEGFRPAGLLGLAGLGKLRWTLDFAARRIRVKD